MTPKRLAAVLAPLAIGALASAAPARAQPSGAVRVRLGTVVPQGTSYDHLLQAMGERWRADTRGQVQLTVYAGTMGGEAELVRRMRLGQLQAAALTAIGLREIDNAVGALQLMPLVYRSLDELNFVRGRMEPLLERRLADRGFVVLFWVEAGWVRIFTRRPVERPADLKRLKIFTTAGDNATYDLIRSAGFTAVPLEWSDVLTGLQTGMVDVVQTIPYHALAMQFYLVTRYMLDLNWAPVVGAVIVSKRVWDALAPETQTALRAAAVETGAQFAQRSRVEADEAVAAMQRRGLTVIKLSPAAQTEWHQLADSLYPHIRGALVPADMFDTVTHLLEEYRSSHPSPP